MVWLLLMACTGTATVEPATAPPAAVEPVPKPTPKPVRLPDPTEARYAASHILVAWKGAVGAPPSVTRTEEEAKARAADLRKQAHTTNFEALAKEYSDGPSAPRGGRLGTYPTGTMAPDFERGVASVRPGELGPLTRTPFGWHVLRRDAIEEVEVEHILISWAGARRSTATRSEAEAKVLATELLTELKGGADFTTLAKERSEDGSAPVGGKLGRIARGQMMPAFEDVVFGMKPGSMSDVVRTSYGFHIIRRTR